MNIIFRKTVCSLMAALIGYTPVVTSYALAEETAEAAKTLKINRLYLKISYL